MKDQKRSNYERNIKAYLGRSKNASIEKLLINSGTSAVVAEKALDDKASSPSLTPYIREGGDCSSLN